MEPRKRPLPAWQWNEIQQVGTDYADVAEVERYEQRMGESRDLAAEDAAILFALTRFGPFGALLLQCGFLSLLLLTHAFFFFGGTLTFFFQQVLLFR